jgi:hypothetical protein
MRERHRGFHVHNDAPTMDGAANVPLLSKFETLIIGHKQIQKKRGSTDLAMESCIVQ